MKVRDLRELRMARQRKQHPPTSPQTPAQEDKGDILRELGAKQDNETGELVADEDKVLEAGAFDTDSIRENRRIQEMVDKKRGNVKGVLIDIDDVLVKYDVMLRYQPANTIRISVKRTTGTPVQQVIESGPRSGSDLYRAMMAIHGQNEEAAYKIGFRTVTGQILGNGDITLPDTRPPQQQGSPPMNPYYPYGPPPPGYPVVPGYVPPGYVPAPQQPQQPQAAATAPAVLPQPVVVHPPPAPDMGAMFESMKQMFNMIQSVYQQAAQQQQHPQPSAAPAAYPMAAPTLPPPPATPDMGAMMAWMRQMFEMIQSMQPPAAAGAPARGRAADSSPAMNPMMMAMMGMPPMQPPPGTMWVPGFGFVPLDRLQAAVGGGGGGPGPGPYRAPYRPPYAAGDPSGGAPPYQGPHNGPPARPLTPAEQFRESMSFIRVAADAYDDLGTVFGRQQQPAEPEGDDSPIQIIDTGPAKIIVNRKDGTLRGWETGWANMDKVFKWVGEQREAIQKSHDAKIAKQQQQQQLPAGYVELTPGYQPPPGYVAVPVNPHEVPAVAPAPAPQQALPPPPAQVPPPMPATPPTRTTWSMPTIPGQGGS